MKKLLGKIFVSADASLVREEDFLVAMDAGCEPRTRGDFIRLWRETRKPIKYAFLTHHHWDHVHNIGYFRERFPGIIVISNRRRGSVRAFRQEQSMVLGYTEYVVIPTPGHTPKGDDICVYLPEKKVLFTGDLCQPQGPSYERTDFATPAPYFHQGEDFIASLKRVLGLKINYAVTGHGRIFRKKALEVTLQAAERMRDLAREVVRDNRGIRTSQAVRAVFERLSQERGFHNPYYRMRDSYFRECDSQGIIYWVKRFKEEGAVRMDSYIKQEAGGE